MSNILRHSQVVAVDNGARTKDASNLCFEQSLPVGSNRLAHRLCCVACRLGSSSKSLVSSPSRLDLRLDKLGLRVRVTRQGNHGGTTGEPRGNPGASATSARRREEAPAAGPARSCVYQAHASRLWGHAPSKPQLEGLPSLCRFVAPSPLPPNGPQLP